MKCLKISMLKQNELREETRCIAEMFHFFFMFSKRAADTYHETFCPGSSGIISFPRLPEKQTQSACNNNNNNNNNNNKRYVIRFHIIKCSLNALQERRKTNNIKTGHAKSRETKFNTEEEELSLTLESLMREEMCAI